MRPDPNDLLTALRGFLMGAADIVPGVSGGTVALIVGVYERLLTAISNFDSVLVRHLANRRWGAAAEHVDLRFLAALGLGIAIGVRSLAGLMHHLLEHHLLLTFAAFFGLILASGILVGRMCRPASMASAFGAVAIGAVAAIGAAWVVSQPAHANGSGLGYVFLSGAIAICAMILPGVSGSYLLVLLGMYGPITGIIKGLPWVGSSDLATLAVFAIGCLFGLLTFSRVLKWLLRHAWTPTMAALCGFMIGSLEMIWPFQATDPSRLVGAEPMELKEKLAAMSPVLPETLDGEAWARIGIASAALVLVLTVDAVARRRDGRPMEPEDHSIATGGVSG